MPLSTKLATLLKCSDSEESIMKFSQEKVAAADALQQLQDMFGSKDTQSLIKAAAEQIAAAEKVKGLVEALQAASGTVGQMDEAQAAAETDAVVSSMVRDIPDVKAREATAGRIRPGVLAARKACLVEQDLCGVKFKRVDEKKLEQFRATYPLPPAELSLLTQRVFAGPGGQQMRLTADPQGNIQQTTLPAAAREPDANDRHAKVRHLAGRNDTERAMTLLAKERPGYASMDRLDQVEIAGQWLRGETD